MKNILFRIGIAICFFPPLLVAESLDTNKSDSQRAQIAEHVLKLEGNRLNALLEYAGKPKSDSVFNCLCRATGRGGVGGGVYYKPGYPCQAVGVLGGHSGPIAFPKESGAWDRCTYSDGHSIVDVVEDALNTDLAGGTVPLAELPKISQQEKELIERNRAYKNACLPSQNKMPDFSRSIKALEVAKMADNLCEEAVAVNLFLNSKRGKTNAAVALNFLGIWFWPGEYDKVGYTNDITGAVSQTYATSMMKDVLGKAFSVAGKIKNLYDTGELYKEEKENRGTDKYYKEAYVLFQQSRNWTMKEITDKEIEVKQKIYSARDDIIKVDDIYNRRHSLLLNEYAMKAGGGGNKLDLYFEDNPAMKTKFDSKEKEITEKANTKKRELLFILESLTLKKNILQKYRKPFSEEGCKNYLSKREEACKKRLLDEARQAGENKARRNRKAMEKAKEIPIGGQLNTLPGGAAGPVIKPKR